MTSGAGAPETPHGDEVSSGRGSAGESSPDPTGGARIVIGMAAMMLSLLCVVLAFIFGVANGLLVLATIFAGVFFWAIGAYHRAFWA